MKTNNVLLEKSYAFALRIIQLYLQLKEQKYYELGGQLLRCGASIGSNAEEAVGAQSTRDFIAKVSISYKEARETRYWLRLLTDSHIITDDVGKNYLADNEELLRIIGAIQLTMKKKIEQKITN